MARKHQRIVDSVTDTCSLYYYVNDLEHTCVEEISGGWSGTEQGAKFLTIAATTAPETLLYGPHQRVRRVLEGVTWKLLLSLMLPPPAGPRLWQNLQGAKEDVSLL